MFVFGLTSDEVINFTRQRNYRSWDVYHSNSVLRQCVDQLINGFFNEDAGEEFRIIYDSLLVYNDEYFVLKDFASYIEAFSNLTDVYHERSTWNRMALVNIEEAGRFSSDRAIEEYAREIWKAKMNNPHPTR
ncbi:fragment of glycogen phosphorylase (part 2/2) [Candidatus Desulfosporosinus infrequens]|uniref:Alpha-1,4 glucan phosphorylase n=1 Tax=Candidatus Desulfosporosinus infrequens TaxID=2043169 RepID=A0A2U3LWD9_9FIRM|nr:fragment of glycogen phosphorylase (part 2/2) [Candidatus Desulfosporosinus infrequens]